MLRSTIMNAKPRTLAATALSLALLLSGCAGGSPEAQMPQDDTHKQAASAAPSPSASAKGDDSTMSTAEIGVTAGAVMAAKLGFDRSRKVTAEELKQLATKPSDTLDGYVVLPGQCAGPLEDLNWSPAQLGTEVARTDFTTESGTVTGSVEVARVEDRSVLEEHYKTVLRMRTDCKSVKLNGPNAMETVKFTDPGIDGVESQLYYSRTGDPQSPQDSLVLLDTAGDYVAMVSFISAGSLNDKQFSTVAKQVMDAVTAQF
ncbi:hypothetical protein GCM10027417_00650 [Glutamicibacter endophyticus]|uniref:hypothetical protein n=1 Tax=Glutamicibacter sp. PS TaxID=3075634 RepID=UPI0028432553|nr:hypothetical protein [Glutamicibacter sp. PS]MDR4531991.1 hypothetical protein [Glutamicibacter sp. PS]